MRAISIVVPTLNETENIPVLLSRIAATFKGSNIRYEVIFVDDLSSDGTIEVIQSLTSKYPISLHAKIGTRGKAYSLLQGFEHAKYNVICMIDADLQYPPEAILPMFQLMESSESDIILTERMDDSDTSKLRQLSSKVFNLVFTQLLFGFKYDSQSGLKIFRKPVIQKVMLDPTPWSFDLEFIVRSLENNYKILSYQIPFSKRLNGEAKVQVLKVTYELARASLKLRSNSSQPKIRQAYQKNLRLAEHAQQAFVVAFIGVAAAFIMAAPSSVSAIGVVTPDGAPAVLTTSPAETVVPLPDVPASAASPANNPRQDALLQTAGSASTLSSPGMVIAKSIQTGDTVTGRSDNVGAAAPQNNTSPISSIGFSDTTYPVRLVAPGYTYAETVKPLSANIFRMWLLAFGSFALIATILINRNKYANQQVVNNEELDLS